MIQDTVISYKKKAAANQKNRFGYVPIFLIWPFLGLLVSFRNFRNSWAKNLFWLFCIFFGYTFVISSQGPDSSRYSIELATFAKANLSLGSILNALYSTDNNFVDIVQPLLTFIISRFTDDSRILFTVFALIFGFFYSRNIWYILERVEIKISLIISFFILTFILLNPIWNINGFRMYAAAQIFIYGALPYLMEKDGKRIFWILFSVFVHFSFVVPVILFVSYLLIGDRLTLFFWFFIISAFITEINLPAVREFLSLLPDIFRLRVESYTTPAYIKNVTKAAAEVNWYIPYSAKVIRWVVYGFSTVVFFNSRNILKRKPNLLRLFCFALFIYGWTNISRNVPSGGRFITLSNLFMFSFFIFWFNLKVRGRLFSLLKYLSVPALLLFIIVSLRIGFDYAGFLTLVGNPFVAPFIRDNVPLIDYIKFFI
jgi:hypothetical protein